MKNAKTLIWNNHKILCFLLFSFLFNARILPQNSTIPGELISPYPTLLNLAIEWLITGDDNQNGIVNVQFREKRNVEWKQGMPLRRVPAGENVGFKWANKFSGSIFDLNPNTRYEIKLNLDDPDGGSAERMLEAQTRPVPVIDDNAEIIEIQPGRYDTLHTKSGTAQRPMVYRCRNGHAAFTYIDIQNKKWVYIEGLEIQNLNKEGIGIQLNGAENCAVTGCNINAVWGLVAYLPGATNCYISDNVVTGTCAWNIEAIGPDGNNIGEGIEMTGPGNVICFNKVTGFRDCLSTMEDQHASNQTCIDMYNNDIYSAADDGIEADFCFSNCRIFQNRITNCFVGLSSQPGLGGPTYFIRNAMYNLIHAAFKLQRYSQGDVILHNTVVKLGTGLKGLSPMDYAFFRNNLAIGGPNGNMKWGGWEAGRPWASDFNRPGSHCSFDYDAVGVYGTKYVAKIGEKLFSEVEKHGIEQITLEGTFSNVKFPFPPFPVWDVPDLRPKAGSGVEDAAVLIPNINDNFSGKAPDCGAYEVGQKLPHYGPRFTMKK